MDLKPTRNSIKVFEGNSGLLTFDAAQNGKIACITAVNQGLNSIVDIVIPGGSIELPAGDTATDRAQSFVKFEAPEGCYDQTEYKVTFRETGLPGTRRNRCVFLIQKYV